MDDFDGSFSSILTNLLGDSQTKTGVLSSLLASVIIFSYTTADLVLNQTDLVDYVQTDKDWRILFDNNVIDDDGDNLTFEYTEIWADQDV